MGNNTLKTSPRWLTGKPNQFAIVVAIDFGHQNQEFTFGSAFKPVGS